MEDINRKDNLWKAIREKCLDCCAGSTKEVDKCTLKGVLYIIIDMVCLRKNTYRIVKN